METSFVRAESSPMTVAELRYDDRDGLLSRGIQLDPPVRDPRDAENDLRDTAQPFPGSRFAQPPRRSVKCRHATSKRPAAPMPPPMHIVTTTYFTPRRFPSMSACPTMRAPLMP